MKIIDFDYWIVVNLTTDMQRIESHSINVLLFGKWWNNAITWRKYTTDLGN